MTYAFEPADGGLGPANDEGLQEDGGADERRDAHGALDDLRSGLEGVLRGAVLQARGGRIVLLVLLAARQVLLAAARSEDRVVR